MGAYLASSVGSWESEVTANIADNLESERYPGDLVHWLAYASGAPSTQSRRSTVFSSKRKYHVYFLSVVRIITTLKKPAGHFVECHPPAGYDSWGLAV